MNEPKPHEWNALELDGDCVAGMAFNRLFWLMRFDPYCGLLTEYTMKAICNLIFSEQHLGLNHITVKNGVVNDVLEALDLSPVANLFTNAFTMHIAELTLISIYGRHAVQ